MNIDDFFDKKSKKKKKNVIKSSDLLNKMNSAPPPKPEPEKVIEDLLPKDDDENNEWEPIVNDVALDLEELKLSLAEEEQNGEDDEESKTKKQKGPTEKFTWDSKKPIEEAPKEEEVKEPPKPKPYVPGAFRKQKDLPKVDDLEEFPTLDAVKNKPLKKTEPKEQVDNSWTDVQRGSSRRKDESRPYVPPALSGQPRYVPPAMRDGNYPPRNSIHMDRPNGRPAESSGGWTRRAVKPQAPPSAPSSARRTEPFERRPAAAPSNTRAYVPPHLRNGGNGITQSNRFAQLDQS